MSEQVQLLNTSILARTKDVERRKRERRKKLAAETIYRKPLPDAMMSFDPQTQELMNLKGETQIVARVWKARCPLCGKPPNLWCIVDKVTKKQSFQVRCVWNSFNPVFPKRCETPSIPDPPIADSRAAVRAWTLAVTMLK